VSALVTGATGHLGGESRRGGESRQCAETCARRVSLSRISNGRQSVRRTGVPGRRSGVRFVIAWTRWLDRARIAESQLGPGRETFSPTRTARSVPTSRPPLSRRSVLGLLAARATDPFQIGTTRSPAERSGPLRCVFSPTRSIASTSPLLSASSRFPVAAVATTGTAVYRRSAGTRAARLPFDGTIVGRVGSRFPRPVRPVRFRLPERRCRVVRYLAFVPPAGDGDRRPVGWVARRPVGWVARRSERGLPRSEIGVRPIPPGSTSVVPRSTVGGRDGSPSAR
jgi:hypothetical protein